jgi:hypothetical protein
MLATSGIGVKSTAELKEALSKLKELTKKDQTQQEAMEAKLAEMTQALEAAEKVKATATDRFIDATIVTVANQFGALNVEHVARLIDRSKVSVDLESGAVVGVNELVKQLKEDPKSAYLFQQVPEDKVPSSPQTQDSTVANDRKAKARETAARRFRLDTKQNF